MAGICAVIDSDSRRRFLVSNQLPLTGHVEPYADCDEFSAHLPGQLVAVLVHHDAHSTVLDQIIDTLDAAGRFEPLIAYGSTPSAELIVDAINQGALDFWALPLDVATVARRLDLVIRRSEQISQRRREIAAAQLQLRRLTPREMDIVRGLARGRSNKEIAKLLDISPRTVEVHRANMMDKLGTRSTSFIVRTSIIADLG